MPLAVDAFAEDCARAMVVVSPRDAPGDCRALLIDRRVWREHGAMALRISDGEIVIKSARSPAYDRPWARPPRRSAVQPSTARDATPPLINLEADD
jgi:competence protein ComEC